MPSPVLKELSDEINKQGPDAFSRFFMYASLLNVITATNRTDLNQQAYTSTLPKAANTLRGFTDLQTGKLSGAFYIKLRDYGESFNNASPDVIKALGMLVNTYRRTSQVADIAFILECMRGELDVMIEPTNSDNKYIYNQLCFDNLKPEVSKVINNIEALSKAVLKGIDAGVNGTLSLFLGITGLALVIQLSSALTLLLGVGMLFGGAYGVYTYGLQAMSAVNQCKTLQKEIQRNEIDPSRVSTWNKWTKDPQYVLNTFVSTLFRPMKYAAVTVKEQFNLDADMKRETDEERQELGVPRAR